jgi:hypothetical protein
MQRGRRTTLVEQLVGTSCYRFCWIIVVAVVLPLLVALSVQADVIVLANRTGQKMSVVVTPATGRGQKVTLPAGDSVPVFLDGHAQIDFTSRGRLKRYKLDADSAYYFGQGRGGSIDLQKIGLGEDAATATGRKLAGSAGSAPPVAVIPVKILVDEEETARPAIWDRRLRGRIEAASAILERHCGVRLNVVATGVWNSDNAINDFHAALGEFEREASPLPGRLAIGFTSQFTPIKGRTHIAGTRGPLHSHILVREGAPQINESERLEFLVHELGHYLGASHSPEKNSVMRPVLGDNRAGNTGFRIRFDPVNTLVMSILGDEMRRSNVQKISDLSSSGKRRLRQIYGALSQAFPNDPASKHFVQLMTASSTMPLAAATKQVLQEIVRSAAANRALPLVAATADGATSYHASDRLTEHCVRAAARAASTLPQEVASNAFVLALGIALDDSDTLQTLPTTAGLARAAETPLERIARIQLLGRATMLGRRDLAQHFFISAHLAAAMGRGAADSAGLAKELVDAQGESGFSFADVAADRAGSRFGSDVIAKRLSLAMLSHSFVVPSFMPSIDGLPENLSVEQFTEQFGANDDERLRQTLSDIDKRINLLSPYRVAEPVLVR